LQRNKTFGELERHPKNHCCGSKSLQRIITIIAKDEEGINAQERMDRIVIIHAQQSSAFESKSLTLE
jgi:hypothetical protein